FEQCLDMFGPRGFAVNHISHIPFVNEFPETICYRTSYRYLPKKYFSGGIQNRQATFDGARINGQYMEVAHEDSVVAVTINLTCIASMVVMFCEANILTLTVPLFCWIFRNASKIRSLVPAA